MVGLLGEADGFNRRQRFVPSDSFTCLRLKRDIKGTKVSNLVAK